MLPRISFATCLSSALAAWAACPGTARADAQPLDVMPAPAEVRVSEGRIAARGPLVVSCSPQPDARLAAAIERACARWRPAAGSPPEPFTVHVECGSNGLSVPDGFEDESYSLEVTPEWGVTITAPSALGVMHGLETLLQLPQRDDEGWSLPVVALRDQPRFAWRGLMIDVARRWQPVEVIERNLNAMAVVKLNVLHLHLTDDQGFRIESRTHPELQAQGSDGHFYTQEQMRGIIAFAAARGIRVVPEFDVPGHATSWVVSHPELASLPGPYGIERQWGVFNPVLDPTKEATYALLGDVLGEMAALFPDRFIHIGGDENNGVQWNANPAIQAFIREHGLKGNEGLHAYFNQRLGALLEKAGKRMVGWDEILNPDLPRSIVIDSWRGTAALASAARLGYDGILSNGFYIDLMHPASEHYLADPIPASSDATEELRTHVLGGEATMWSEWVSPETIDSRIWPRTAAIAERLWSPADVRDVPDMYRRLALVSQRLAEAGSLHGRNRDVLLRHLVGENLTSPSLEPLRTFLDLVEPVKAYRRGALQVWGNQLVPLVGVADAAQPESTLSREFADSVGLMLFAPGAIDRAEAGALAGRLKAWGAAGKAVAEQLAPEYPALREAIPSARNLAAACAVGADAAQAIAAGAPLGPDRAAAGFAALDLASQENASATEVPLVVPVRLLVAAAARQGERPGLPDAEWRSRVTSAAAASAPAGARN